MASYCFPVQWITTVWGISQCQSSRRGSLPFPLESLSLPSLSVMADDLYSTRKYHFRRLGGVGIGITLAPLSPTRQSCKKGLHCRINTMSMQQVIGIGRNEPH